MNKKLQVFVSSTYTDLIEERQTAVEAILDAGHIPAGMELFKAGKSQMKTIQKWIDESDVYMLILGGRYGSIEEESGLSYTELEYRYAVSKGMPVFAIVLEDSFLFTKAATKGKDAIFENKNKTKYNLYKKYIKTNIVKFVSNIDQLSSQIYSHLNDIQNDSDYNLIGWIRSNYMFCNELIGNYTIDEYKKIMSSQIFHLYLEDSSTNKIVITAWDLFKHKDFYNAVSNGISERILAGNEEQVLYNTVVDFYVKLGLLTETGQIGEHFAELSQFGYKLFSKM